MKIELRKVAHYPRMSQETEAFNADLYIDGVKRGTVQNEGMGGPNVVHPWQLGKEIEEYAKTLPPEEMFGRMVPISGDYLISTILENHLIEKDLQKALKKKTLFLLKGKIYEMKAPHRPDARENAVVLNDLAFEKALDLYKKHAVK